MKLPSILVIQRVVLIAVFPGMASYPAYAEKDDQLLLHISKGHVVSIAFQEKEADFTGCWIGAGKGSDQSQKNTIWRDGTKYKMKTVRIKDVVYSGDVKNDALEAIYTFRGVKDMQHSPQWTQGGIPDKVATNVWPHFQTMGNSLRLTGPDKISGVFHGYHLSYDRQTLDINWQKPQDKPFEWRREIMKIRALDMSGTDKMRKGIVSPASELFISAESEPGCDLTRDHMTVQLYPDNDKGEAVEITLIESEVDSNKYFLANSRYPLPAKSTSPAWARPYTRLTVTQKGSMRGDSVRVDRGEAAKLEKHLDQVSSAQSELESLSQQWKDYSDQIDEQRDKGNDVTNLVRNEKRLTAEIQQARKKLVALNKKYGTPGDIEKKLAALKPVKKKTPRPKSAPDKTSPSPQPGFSFGGIPNPFGFGAKPPAAGKGKAKGKPGAGKGRGIPPVAGGGAPPAIAAAKCPEKSPDPECWTDKQLQTEKQRLETLSRRINGGEGVAIYKRHYKMPDGHLITRLESGDRADYEQPFDMTGQSRFIRKKSLIDALRRAKSGIESILAKRGG